MRPSPRQTRILRLVAYNFLCQIRDAGGVMYQEGLPVREFPNRHPVAETGMEQLKFQFVKVHRLMMMAGAERTWVSTGQFGVPLTGTDGRWYGSEPLPRIADQCEASRLLLTKGRLPESYPSARLQGRFVRNRALCHVIRPEVGVHDLHLYAACRALGQLRLPLRHLRLRQMNPEDPVVVQTDADPSAFVLIKPFKK